MRERRRSAALRNRGIFADNSAGLVARQATARHGDRQFLFHLEQFLTGDTHLEFERISDGAEVRKFQIHDLAQPLKSHGATEVGHLRMVAR